VEQRGNVILAEAVENEKERAHAKAVVKSAFGVGKINSLLMIQK
jgi:osmotically-inducible protein OsmY